MPIQLLTDGTIPKKIHFIWLGGNVPEKYCRNILSFASIAKKYNFEINLWVDKESNYYNTSEKADIKIPNLNLKSISDLKKGIDVDPFFNGFEQNDLKRKRKDLLLEYIDRELIGNDNKAAASDILRLIILHLHGGYYFDTDVFLKNPSQAELIPDSSPYGFLFGPVGAWSITNAIVASTPKNSIIESLIGILLKNYKTIDKMQMANSKYFSKNQMDNKRLENKLMGTMEASGPGIFMKLLDSFPPDFDPSPIAFLRVEDNQSLDEVTCANASLFHKSDHAWMNDYRNHEKIVKKLYTDLTDIIQSKSLQTDFSNDLLNIQSEITKIKQAPKDKSAEKKENDDILAASPRAIAKEFIAYVEVFIKEIKLLEAIFNYDFVDYILLKEGRSLPTPSNQAQLSNITEEQKNKYIIPFLQEISSKNDLRTKVSGLLAGFYKMYRQNDALESHFMKTYPLVLQYIKPEKLRSHEYTNPLSFFKPEKDKTAVEISNQALPPGSELKK